MACSSMLVPGQTLEQRNKEITSALKELEKRLTTGTVTITIAPNGAIAFKGWPAAERKSISDVCGYRTLAAGNSWALRQAVARAEAMQGRKVNERAIAAGVHSHDGGGTWHKGH